MDITVAAVVAAVLATLVGASIQGAIGFGMNLVTVPVLALVLPESLPATVILLGMPMASVMWRHERHAVDRAGLWWILGGRVPGTVIGTIIVASVTVTALKGFIGVAVLLTAIASAIAPPIRVNRATQFAGGVVSGTTGTAAGIGGPPLALLYQHHPGPTLRATLAASFLFGTFFSVIALTVAHEILLADVWLAIGLIPVVVAGSWIGRRGHDVLDRKWLRPAVITFAIVAALVVIADALH